MKLCQLLGRVAPVGAKGDTDTEITHLSHSCDDIRRGTLFFCLEGASADGHEFAAEAVIRGAAALVVNRFLPLGVPQIAVRNTRRAMSVISRNFYGNPSEKLKTIAVTGTNGKTSTCFITAAVLSKGGRKCGIIGTNGIFYGGKRFDSELTTPDPIVLNSVLADMVKAGTDTVVFEASAHAIALSKLDGTVADIGVFTNLSQDHLDFFGTMERYGEVKRSFFSPSWVKAAVVNSDDSLGAKLSVNPLVPTFTYGSGHASDAHFACYSENENGSEYYINLKGTLIQINTGLSGRFNAYNATAAASVCYLLGIEPSVIAQGIGEVSAVPGRNETVFVDGIKCVVDFAHTPDGMENILSLLRNATGNGKSAAAGGGRLIVVFGCGGDRDKSKRPLMGKAASRYADYVILTEDNPRSERAENIVSEIAEGVTVPFKVITDRREAVSAALSEAKSGDTVAILGKGAEKEIIRGKERIPYSDKEFLLSLKEKTRSG